MDGKFFKEFHLELRPRLTFRRSSMLIRWALIASLLAMVCVAAVPTKLTVAQATESCPISPAAKLTWVSPRGTLEVMDDYPLWVAKKLGYFDQMGINIDLQPGPLGGANVMALLPAKQADVSFPSPGVLA